MPASPAIDVSTLINERAPTAALIAAAAIFAKGGWTRGAGGTQPAAPGHRAPGGAAVQGARI